jgi:hypothetical protein
VSLGLQVPVWSPPGGDVKVDVEGDDAEKVDTAEIENIKGELYSVDTASLAAIEAHDFEKDDDTNFHIDFMTSATNMRAANYDIKATERAQVKVTAGRIIPALATTTAMICGLVDIEFLKLVKGLHKEENALDLFYNANVNLATGSEAINVFRPEPVIKKESKVSAMPEYTTWDKIEMKGPMTVKELVEQLTSTYGVTVQRVSPAGDDKNTLYEAVQVKKMAWKIELSEDGVLTMDPEDEVLASWPTLRMAKQMLPKLQPGGARTNFENQVKTSMKALKAVQDSFVGVYNGAVYEAFVLAARPKEDEEKQVYFDAVYADRPYVALQAGILNAAGEDANLPVIKYTR